jgi:hypothetical protein
VARSPLSPVATLVIAGPPPPPPSIDVRPELAAAQTALDAAATALLSARDHIARALAGIG